MEIEFAITSIRKGELPKNLDEKVNIVRAVEKVVMLSTNLISIVLATARAEDFGDDESKWGRWVTEKFAYSKEHRCHLALIGKMLIGMRERYPECFERLFLMNCDKNLAIARLYRGNGSHDVQRFLAANVEKMSREEVRDAVDLCMNIKTPEKEEPKKKNAKTEPMGLVENIDTICNFDLEKIRRLPDNPKFLDATAGKSIVFGIELLAAGLDQHENKHLSLQAPKELIDELKEKAYRAYKKLEFWSVKSEQENLPTTG